MEPAVAFQIMLVLLADLKAAENCCTAPELRVTAEGDRLSPVPENGVWFEVGETPDHPIEMIVTAVMKTAAATCWNLGSLFDWR